MSLLSGFVKFCTSGFGTGTDFGKAVGWTVLICLGVFIIAIWVIKWIIKLIKHFTAKKEEPTTPSSGATE